MLTRSCATTLSSRSRAGGLACAARPRSGCSAHACVLSHSALPILPRATRCSRGDATPGSRPGSLR
eukprot:3672409-Prymnesium_polylepis.1